MRARIEAVASSGQRSSLVRPSLVRLAARAARRVLKRAGHAYSDVDLVVNVGIYRDGNVCEPALASLIQREMGGPARRAATFSFDLNNGACGLINALGVVDSFVRSGSIQRALIVAADVDPAPRRSRGYGFDPVGVAVLVAAGGEERGFEAFAGETFAKHSALFESRLDWVPRGGIGRRGGHTLTLREGEGFAERCADCAAVSTDLFLRARGLRATDIDLLVAPNLPEGFAEGLADRVGIPRERVCAAHPTGRRAHTAGIGLALAAAFEDGRLARARRALLATAGSGVSVALALYA